VSTLDRVMDIVFYFCQGVVFMALRSKPIHRVCQKSNSCVFNQSINQNSLSSRPTSRLIIKLTHDDVRV